MKKHLFIGVGLLMAAMGGFAQVSTQQNMDEELEKLHALPELKMTESLRLKSLPTSLDNTEKAYFPEIFNQYGWSCNQANSIGYLLTYELNAQRERPATVLENQYPPLFVWNLLNDADAGNGVSYFDSWEAIRMNGTPNFADFGWDHYNENKWMTDYDKYYSSMHNRISRMYTIFTDTEEGIQTLKHWLKDHMGASSQGGLANFQIGSGGMHKQVIPEGEPAAGSYLMTNYGEFVGHAMTVVGWDDNVRWDYNGDGEYTNDVDLNADGIIDIRDHEIGAFLIVNSWGSGWGNKGRVYVPYRLFAMEPVNGGIWEQCVTVVDVAADYQPQLTFKVGLTYTKRKQLKIIAGVAQDLGADRPDHVLEFPFFNYKGGYLPMQGVETAGNDFIEFGLDVTPLLAYVNPNQQAKFFLEVYERQMDEAAGHGEINYFSVMDYGLGQLVESTSPYTDETINTEAVTRVFAFHTPMKAYPQIDQTELPQAAVGTGYIQSLTASGGTAPYTFSSGDGQYQSYKKDEAWSWPSGLEQVLGISDTSRMVVDLGFTFTFYGKEYDQVILLKDGGIMMGGEPRDYPYVIDKRLITMQNAGIYPLYGQLEYGYIGDGVYRKDMDDGVIFAWDATMSKYAGFYNPQFGLYLHENGNFTFGFNDVALIPEWDWISVVSAGDQIHYTLTEMNNVGVWRGKETYDFRYFEFPDWLFMTTNGGLLGTPPATASSRWIPFTVTDANHLTSSKMLFLDIAGGMGVDDQEPSTEVRMYPNPAAGELFVEVDVEDGDQKVSMINLSGQVVLEDVIASGESRHKIDISGLKQGIYFVEVGVERMKLVVK